MTYMKKSPTHAHIQKEAHKYKWGLGKQDTAACVQQIQIDLHAYEACREETCMQNMTKETHKYVKYVKRDLSVCEKRPKCM